MSEVTNITQVFFNGKRSIWTDPLTWYDYGQILQFPDIDLPVSYEVDYSNTEFFGESVRQIGDANGVLIPDALLDSGASFLFAWIFLHAGAEDGETVYKITIPLDKRAKRSEAEPTPVQQDAITQAIAALNAAVETTAEDARQTGLDAASAHESAEDSEAWAVGTKGGEPVSEEAPQFDNNAAYWADKAEQSAGQAGYMFFYIDEHGHLIYERTSNVDVDFVLENGHLYVEAIA